MDFNDLGTKIFGSGYDTYWKDGRHTYTQTDPNIIQRIQSLFTGQPALPPASPSPSPKPIQGNQITTPPVATPITTSAPVATPSPTTFNDIVPQQGAGFRIAGVPNNIAQSLGSNLDQYGLATEAAQVLSHPREQTYTPSEIKKFGHENWNGGENPQFVTTNTNTTQANGTIDTGLMRENSQPFKELQGSHKWNTILKDNGINSFNDLQDTANSIKYAKILGDYYEQDLGLPRWSGWFAAPLGLRTKPVK